MAILRQTCPETGRDYQARELSHVQAHFWNASECEWREPKGSAGIATARKPESDHGRLYASRQSAEARGPEQAGEVGHEKDRLILTGPNWTMKKNGGFAEVLYFVGVPDGI
jgi:hypothetical protein